jgi:hypothetical protein
MEYKQVLIKKLLWNNTDKSNYLADFDAFRFFFFLQSLHSHEGSFHLRSPKKNEIFNPTITNFAVTWQK